MLQLLKKEMRLTASPLSYIFLAFSLMTLIPRYPILVGAFFICFGVFQTFQKARESNDTLYSCLLPVKKSDIVKSKFAFTLLIQSAGLVPIIVFTLLRIFALNNLEPYSGNALMNANLAYVGYVLVVFACFNIFFVGGFFKTAYKIGIPFLMFGIAAAITIVVGEALHFFPGLDVLNDSFHWSHFIVFSAGLAFYVVGTVVSMRKAQKNFERIDL